MKKAYLNYWTVLILAVLLCAAFGQVATAEDEPAEVVDAWCFPLAAFATAVQQSNYTTIVNIYPGVGGSAAAFTSLSADVVPNQPNLKDLLSNPASVPPLAFGALINVTSKPMPPLLEEIANLFANQNNVLPVVLPVVDAGPDSKGPYPVLGLIGFTITDAIPEGSNKGIYGSFTGIIPAP